MAQEQLQGGSNCFGLLNYASPVLLDTILKRKAEKSFDPRCAGDNGDSAAIGIDEILDTIAPTKEFESGGRLFRQSLSKETATRQDAIRFQLRLNEILRERQARTHGLDPIRREIFTCAFDEIIRQVTVESPPRGLLLLRIRDEIRMTLRSYHLLYEQAVDHGRQCADDGYNLVQEMKAKIASIEEQTATTRARVQDLQQELDHTKRKLQEQSEMEAKHFAEQVQFIKRANQQLRQETEALTEYKAPDE